MDVFNLETLLKKYESKIPDFFFIVCNSKNKTQLHKDYKTYSIQTEFLSDAEVEELMLMAKSQNLPFDIFYSEEEFMKKVFHHYEALSNMNIVVYNSAQNGTGAGRKSLIPAFCNLMEIRCTGSDSYRVSLCRDKFAINSILKANNINVPNSILFNPNKYSFSVFHNAQKIIAKPLYESASIGITEDNIFYSNKVPIDYLTALSDSLKQSLLLQEFIEGYEIEVPLIIHEETVFCFDPVILFLDKTEKFMGESILNYEKIYNDSYCFGDLPEHQQKYVTKIKKAAKEVVQILGLNGLCRVDGRLTKKGEFYITDVSTNPHFIKHSSVNYAFSKLGYTDKELFRIILTLC